MSTPLRINEALLIAGDAFEPFQCVAWAPQDGNGELSLTVIDRSNTRICCKQIPSSAYSDPAQLESLLEEARAELSQEGYKLQSWTMPDKHSRGSLPVRARNQGADGFKFRLYPPSNLASEAL